MTTQQKLLSFRTTTGRTWGNIAEILGISRQMLDFVRRGERNFSPDVESRLDAELSKITTNDPLYGEENVSKVFLEAYRVIEKHPKSRDMIGWFASAMTEAANSLREHSEGNTTEAKARAYEAQRIFSRIFTRAFEEPK